MNKCIIFLILVLFYSTKTFAYSHYECFLAINKIEKKYKLPNKLLSAISLTETGRTINGSYKSWPWSLNVSGQAFIFENKKQTQLFLEEKIKEIKNIDIGCMQINYKYHNADFQDIESILDPQKNVEWAAKFLIKLHKKYKSWNTAISRYHSSDPVRMKNYLKKVHVNWNLERQKKNKTYIPKLISQKSTNDSNLVKSNNKDLRMKRDDKINYFRKELAKNKSRYF